MKRKLEKETIELLERLKTRNHFAESSDCLKIVDLYLRHQYKNRIDGFKPEAQLMFMYDRLKKTYNYE